MGPDPREKRPMTDDVTTREFKLQKMTEFLHELPQHYDYENTSDGDVTHDIIEGLTDLIEAIGFTDIWQMWWAASLPDTRYEVVDGQLRQIASVGDE